MKTRRDMLRFAAIALLGALCLGFGLHAEQTALAVVGAVGLAYAVLAATFRLLRKGKSVPLGPIAEIEPGADDGEPNPDEPALEDRTGAGCVDADDAGGLVRRMLSQSRYALLLRSQIVPNLTPDQFRLAREQLHARMALVPDGDVVLRSGTHVTEGGSSGSPSVTQNRRIRVAAVFLDRRATTNRQYYEFVSAGGYREMAYWDPLAWPAVLDMVDRTGEPGPAFWRNGRYLPGEEELPVVGISWYEAQAYARWLGKRLPTDAEWVKAAAWPIAADGAAVNERRYPWGDTLDHGRANVWGVGPNGPVNVGRFSEGISVGGIEQLVGNVWEWQASDFWLAPNQIYSDNPPLKSIRGGAFDTYFENQATCQFQSGEYPLSRRHNIGFRCAVGVCDLVLALPDCEASGLNPEATPECEALPV